MPSTKTSWIETNVGQLRKNLAIFRKDLSGLNWWSVVKDQAYGHGAITVGRETLEAGASKLAVANIEEALELKAAFPNASILIFGERPGYELEACIENQFEFFVNDANQAKLVNEIGKKHGKKITVHVEIDTGMSRYGISWNHALPVIESIASASNLTLSSVMTHFAMSDELDKTFANLQLSRFEECIPQIKKINSSILVHACNTGGFLDLPKAHLDLVRIGILPLGVYPSEVCRRVSGIEPIMSMKTKIASIKKIEAGDVVGYGMHYKATKPTNIAVLPMGYGRGYPRLRNKGHVLINGKQAPIVGGNAMNAIMVDITDIPSTKVWDEVVVLGKQGDQEITMRDLAAWAGTVPYDIMARLITYMPRIFIN
jgi:alanine racemase